MNNCTDNNQYCLMIFVSLCFVFVLFGELLKHNEFINYLYTSEKTNSCELENFKYKCNNITNWHASLDIDSIENDTYQCTVLVQTDGDTCKSYCEKQNRKCLYAQSNTKSCYLDQNPYTQTIAENGCLQRHDQQICRCDCNECPCHAEVYSNGDFTGKKGVFDEVSYNMGYIEKSGVRTDDIESVKVFGKRCQLKLFEHGNYKGCSVTFPEGNYSATEFVKMGGVLNSASSLSVIKMSKEKYNELKKSEEEQVKCSSNSTGCCVVVYDKSDFSGSSFKFEQGTYNLSQIQSQEVNNVIQALEVTGDNCLINIYYNQIKAQFNTGKYNGCRYKQHGGLSSTASSLSICHRTNRSSLKQYNDTCKVSIYTEINFGGTITEFQVGDYDMIFIKWKNLDIKMMLQVVQKLKVRTVKCMFTSIIDIKEKKQFLKRDLFLILDHKQNNQELEII